MSLYSHFTWLWNAPLVKYYKWVVSEEGSPWTVRVGGFFVVVSDNEKKEMFLVIIHNTILVSFNGTQSYSQSSEIWVKTCSVALSEECVGMFISKTNWKLKKKNCIIAAKMTDSCVLDHHLLSVFSRRLCSKNV